jgi:ribosome-associated heat shock protein Hsp15
MRLDKFLFFIRLTKTRTLAQAIITTGHVRVDGRPVQNGHKGVAPGQVITLPLGAGVRVIRVLSLPSRRGPASEAQTHYIDLAAKDPIDVGEARI